MTTEQTWSPGTIKLLQDEAVRLGDIAAMLEDLASDLRSVAPEGWAGRAADAYGELRDRLVKQCRLGAGAYETAAGATESYVQILVELAGRRHFETASDSLARLEQQRVEAAEQLESAWRAATGEFEAIRGTLPELVTPAVAAVEAPRRAPMAGRQDAPVPRFGDPRYVQDLSDAILEFFARMA
ncbi:putative T7SS-secreted protein [Amycolatopsis sp. NPDC058278]|uniref:putative T7SS-secreted protein n=1 Tax=Amycolatopsis sp. NPDC058278 TaxID=3346417 RepID=UPI0036D977C3